MGRGPWTGDWRRGNYCRWPAEIVQWSRPPFTVYSSSAHWQLPVFVGRSRYIKHTAPPHPSVVALPTLSLCLYPLPFPLPKLPKFLVPFSADVFIIARPSLSVYSAPNLTLPPAIFILLHGSRLSFWPFANSRCH